MPTPFQIHQDGWILIAPLGDHDHMLGIKRIVESSNPKMANTFNILLAKPNPTAPTSSPRCPADRAPPIRARRLEL